MSSQNTPNKSPRIGTQLTDPSPANYLLPPLFGRSQHDPSKQCSPAYTIAERIYYQMPSKSPGPVHYVPNNVTRYGRGDTKNHTMLSKTNEKKKEITPGPGTYSPENHPVHKFPATSQFSFSTRTNMTNLSKGPSPNSYTLPSGRSKVSRTMGINYTRGSYSEDLASTPGPGTYDSSIPTKNKNAAPSYSILGRGGEIMADKNIKPGPSHYVPRLQATKPSAPSFSMGQRYTNCLTLLHL